MVIEPSERNGKERPTEPKGKEGSEQKSGTGSEANHRFSGLERVAEREFQRIMDKGYAEPRWHFNAARACSYSVSSASSVVKRVAKVPKLIPEFVVDQEARAHFQFALGGSSFLKVSRGSSREYSISGGADVSLGDVPHLGTRLASIALNPGLEVVGTHGNVDVSVFVEVFNLRYSCPVVRRSNYSPDFSAHPRGGGDVMDGRSDQRSF